MPLSLNDVSSMVLPPALLWILFSDLLYRRIANWIVIGLLVAWLASVSALALRSGTPLQLGPLGTGMLSAALVLALGYALFVMRWVGAGDVKLMAVLCLWCGAQAPTFLIVTSLAGGILALGMPLIRTLETTLARGVDRLSLMWPVVTPPKPILLRANGTPGLPYGLAIAAGAAFVLYSH